MFGSVGISDYVVGPLLVTQHDKDAFCRDRRDRSSRQADPRIMAPSICINNTMAAVEQA